MAATDFAVRLDTKDFMRSKQQIIAGFSDIDKSAQNAGSSLDGMGKKIAGAAAAYFSIQQAQQFLNKVIEIRGQFQKLDIAFTTMLQGNKEASSKLMNELTEFASVTPFGLMDAASGAKQLIAYGFAAENVVKDMEMLGNVASGVSAPLNDIVYLYGTLKASGRVMTMDIRQFAGRGIPIYRELAAVLGVAESEINDMVSAGKVGFKDIEKAFQRMTGQGGTFYNLMREQSKSLPGQISNLEDSIDVMFNEIGAASQEFISKGIEGIAWLVENYEKVGRTLLELVATYGAYKVALVAVKVAKSGMTVAELAHYAAIVATEKAQKALNATMLKNPYVLAAAGIAALGYGMYKLITYQTDAEINQNKLNEAFAHSQANAAKEVAELDRLKGSLSGCTQGSQAYLDIKQEIIQKFGKYDSTLTAEALSVQTLADKYDILKRKIKESANQRMYNEWLSNNNAEFNKKETNSLNAIYEGLKKVRTPSQAAELYQKFVGAVYKGFNPANRDSGYKDVYEALHAGDVGQEAYNYVMLYKQNQKLLEEARLRFGITSQGGDDDYSGGVIVTAELKNKAYWEEQKKIAEETIAKFTTPQLQSAKAISAKQKLQQAIQELEKYETFMKGGKGIVTQAKEEPVTQAKEETDKILADYLTYEQQRTAIKQKYTDIRNRIEAEGGTEGNIKEANIAEEQELAQIDEKFASRFAEYEIYINSIADMTLATLREQIGQLEELLSNSNLSEGEIAQTRAKINALKKREAFVEAEEKSEKKTTPKKRSIEEWKDVQDVIQDSIDVFEELGDAIGGTAGEIISSASDIAASTLAMVNGIVQLVDMSVVGVEKSAEAGSKAIQQVERASVILAIISAAMKIAMKIASLFNNDDEHQERIEEYQRRLDELEFQRNNPEIVKLWDKRGKSMDVVNNIIARQIALTIQARKAEGDFWGAWEVGYKGLEIGTQEYNEAIQSVVDSYKQLSYSDAYSTQLDQLNSLDSQLTNIAEQQVLIAQQNAEEEKMKDPDEGKLAEYREKQEELTKEALQVISDAMESIIGGSARDIAEQLSDAFWEAAKEGKNAMEALEKETDDIIADIIKRMLVTQLLEPEIVKVFDRYKERWFPDNKGFVGGDKVREDMEAFGADIRAAAQPFMETTENLPEWMKEYLMGEAEAERQSSSRGIATASQESVDENNARLTTIQAHTASIAGNVDEMVKEIREQRLTSLRTAQIADDIRANTIEMVKHLQGIENNTAKLDKTLSDIALKGIKMK